MNEFNQQQDEKYGHLKEFPWTVRCDRLVDAFQKLNRQFKGKYYQSTGYVDEKAGHYGRAQMFLMYLNESGIINLTTQNTLKRAYRDKPKYWKIINNDHVLLIVDVLLWMSVFPKKDVRMHWHPIYGTKQIKDQISYHRFRKVFAEFTFYNPLMTIFELTQAQQGESDNSYKIRGVVDGFNDAAKVFVNKPPRACVDEFVMCNECRSGLNRKQDRKPGTGRGVVMFKATDGRLYCHHIVLDCQNTDNKCKKYNNVDDKKGGKILMLICEEAHFEITNSRTQTKTVVTTDKFYTRPKVMKYLKQKKNIDSAGTVRNYGSEFPPSLFTGFNGAKLGKGSKRFKLSKDREILATGFHDSTLVGHYTTEKINHMNLVRARKHRTNNVDELECQLKQLNQMSAMKVREYAKQRGISTRDTKNEIIERIITYWTRKQDSDDNTDDNESDDLNGYNLLSNEDLRNICRARNLPVYGNKNALAVRLKSFDDSVINATESSIHELTFSKDTDKRNLPQVRTV